MVRRMSALGCVVDWKLKSVKEMHESSLMARALIDVEFGWQHRRVLRVVF